MARIAERPYREDLDEAVATVEVHVNIMMHALVDDRRARQLGLEGADLAKALELEAAWNLVKVYAAKEPPEILF